MDESITRLKLRRLKRMLQAGLDFFIPPHCMGCGSMGSVWCEQCQLSRCSPQGPSCTTCGIPRVFQDCPACSMGLSSFHVAAIAAYRPSLSDALVAFKYRPDVSFAELLAGWAIDKVAELGWQPELIVPVPLNQVRLKQRGYNQVELITSAITSLSSISHGNSILKRVRDTRSQVGLDPRSRYTNMVHAFCVDEDLLSYERVLLIDDLLTTGATIIACAQALFTAGAEEVNALAIAKA